MSFFSSMSSATEPSAKRADALVAVSDHSIVCGAATVNDSHSSGYIARMIVSNAICCSRTTEGSNTMTPHS